MHPKLIVFDLDFTLWDCGGTWCDCLSPPFHVENGNVFDSTGSKITLYDDVQDILDRCDQLGIAMALASRTEQPSWARQLVDYLGITDRFSFAEIYPSSKVRHFEELRRQSGFDYEQMLFFDDEMRNIRECSGLGVECVFVDNGLSLSLFEEGFRKFA